MSKNKNKKEQLLSQSGEQNFDIRSMHEYEIRQYYASKYKTLDFGVIFDKGCAENQLKDGKTYTDDQWDHMLRNFDIFDLDEEHDYLWNFLRIGLKRTHRDFPEIYEGIHVSELIEIDNDAYWTYGDEDYEEDEDEDDM